MVLRRRFIDLQGDANVGGMLSDGMKWLLALIPLTATHADAGWPPIVPPKQAGLTASALMACWENNAVAHYDVATFGPGDSRL